MAIKSFKQGEDVIVSLQILDKTGVAINLSSVPTIKALVKVNDQVQSKRYSLIPATGLGKLEVDNSITNQINVFLERAETASFPEGPVKLVTLISFTDSEFDDGDRTEEFSGIVGKCLLGEGKNEPLP
jgi:hypothetical protein